MHNVALDCLQRPNVPNIPRCMHVRSVAICSSWKASGQVVNGQSCYRDLAQIWRLRPPSGCDQELTFWSGLGLMALKLLLIHTLAN